MKRRNLAVVVLLLLLGLVMMISRRLPRPTAQSAGLLPTSALTPSPSFTPTSLPTATPTPETIVFPVSTTPLPAITLGEGVALLARWPREVTGLTVAEWQSGNILRLQLESGRVILWDQFQNTSAQPGPEMTATQAAVIQATASAAERSQREHDRELGRYYSSSRRYYATCNEQAQTLDFWRSSDDGLIDSIAWGVLSQCLTHWSPVYWAPDDSAVAFSIDWQLYVMQLPDGNLRSLAYDVVQRRGEVLRWSPDSHQIMFYHETGTGALLGIVDASAETPPQLYENVYADLSPDGAPSAAFWESDEVFRALTYCGAMCVWYDLHRVDTGELLTFWPEDPLSGQRPQRSPDGRWLMVESRYPWEECERYRCDYYLIDLSTAAMLDINSDGTGTIIFYRWTATSDAFYYAHWPRNLAEARTSRARWGLYALDPDTGETEFLLENVIWMMAGPDRDTAWILVAEVHPSSLENALQIGLFDLAQQQWLAVPRTVATGGAELIIPTATWMPNHDRTVVLYFDIAAHRLYRVTTGDTRLLVDGIPGNYDSRFTWSPDGRYLLAVLSDAHNRVVFPEDAIREIWVLDVAELFE